MKRGILSRTGGRRSVTVGRFAGAIALLGVAMLAISAGLTTRLYAEESAQAGKTAKPEAEALWVISNGGNYTPSIAVFSPAVLKKSGTVGSFGMRVNGAAVEALTFDGNHNLWFGLCGKTSAVVELTRAGLRSLLAHGRAKFSTVITNPAAPSPEYLDCPQAIQFDPAGNLWVAQPNLSYTAGTPLIEYSSNDLLSSGGPVPAAIIETPTQEEFYGLITLAFDHAGNLWQSSSGIFEYTAAQLAAGAQTEPNQTLLLGGTWPELQSSAAIAFDANDNLWVSFENGGTGNYGGLESFAAADLNGQGTVSPTPDITIGAAPFGRNLGIASPDALAFDGQGDLWVGNTLQPRGGLGDGSLVEFTPSQLSASGSPVPTREIMADTRNTNIGRPTYITFGPPLP